MLPGGNSNGTTFRGIHSGLVIHTLDGHRPRSGRRTDAVGMSLDELERRHQLIRRSTAIAAGVSPGAIAHRTGPRGRWQRVLPGIYATHHGSLTTEQQYAAALLYAGPEALLSGTSVTSLVGLRTAPNTRMVHILIPHTLRRHSEGFVRISRGIRTPETRRINGFPTVTVARAVVETCRHLTDIGSVRALIAESVQRHRTTIRAIAEELEAGARQHSALSRRVLAEVADGVRSPAEGAAYRLVHAADLPQPIWNRDVFLAGQWLARPDAYWPDEAVALEIDSRRWHLGPAEWEQTMRRHARLTGAGVVVVHVSPSRVHQDSRGVLRDLSRALAARRCVGSSLPLSVVR